MAHIQQAGGGRSRAPPGSLYAGRSLRRVRRAYVANDGTRSLEAPYSGAVVDIQVRGGEAR